MAMDKDRALDCFRAGMKAKEINDTVISAITWLEYRDSKLAGSAFWQLGQQAGTLSMLLDGSARQKARELAAGARDLEKAVKGTKELIPKPKAKKLLTKLLNLKDKYNLVKDAEVYCTGRKPKKK
jgi:hypothetical protein